MKEMKIPCGATVEITKNANNLVSKNFHSEGAHIPTAFSGVRMNLMLARYFLFCLLLTAFCLLLQSCKTTSPVSSNTITSNRLDSILTRFTTRKDSSFYKETVEQKKLEGASIRVLVTRDQIDSLIRAVNALPKSVPQQIIYSDPKQKAELKLAKDSLGRLYVECQSKDQYYFEKQVQQGRVIESLTKEINKVREENNFLKHEVVKQNQSLGERFNSFIKNSMWLAIISTVLYLAFNFFVLKRLKLLKA